MCSVNFIYQNNLGKEKMRKSIDSMVASSNHRGPDATEVLVESEFALGFNRLQIVGGKLGSQPIYDKANGLLIICNGEIFNHKELQKDYFSNDPFLTKSDVEIILHLYKKFGEQSISYLEGQFSYILYDLNKKKVILGRDRFGINPLFYYLNNRTLIVASEIKSILASRLTKNVSLDQKGIIESLLFYGAIPPRTCFTNVLQVPPANYVTYNLLTNQLEQIKYWEINKNEEFQSNKEQSSMELRELLFNSVRKRLQGESIPGVYLSGGIDSSIIAFIVNQLSDKKPRLFSIAFEDKRYDESQFQEEVARNLNIELEQLRVSFEDIAKNLQECIYHVETPLIRTAPIPMMWLSKKVKSTGTKFVLCGEGADEMFAGYPVFIKNKASIEEKWDTISQYIKLFQDSSLNSYIAKMKGHIIDEANDVNKLSHNRKKEIMTKLSQYLLVNQGDRMSMANGVEQRFPFLDTDLVNYAFSLDDDLLIMDNQGKQILREAFRKDLPAELINRKKQGYLAPDDTVIRAILVDGRYNYLLKESYFNKVNIFDYSKTHEIIERITRSIANLFDANALLFILTTHLLHDIFIKNNRLGSRQD